MKHLYFFLFLLFFYAESKEQNTVIGSITYDFSFLQDPKNQNSIFEEIMVLKFSKTNSVFKSQVFEQSQKLEDERMKKVFEKTTGNVIVDTGKSLLIGSPVQYFNFYKEGVNYQTNYFIGTKYLIKQPLERINWKIENTVKGIGGFGCQKAVGVSHGRTYIAWFCADIPYSYGPRKLQGLPGMILEAYDENKEVVYKLRSVDLRPVPNEVIELPKNAVSTTVKEFIRLVEAYQNGAGSGNNEMYGNVTIESKGDNNNYRKKTKVKVNLIDLD